MADSEDLGKETGVHDAFVSYALPDTRLANDIVVALESQGLRCWIAPRDVTPGAHYASEIVHAIDAAQVRKSGSTLLGSHSRSLSPGPILDTRYILLRCRASRGVSTYVRKLVGTQPQL